jgi:hypothetical protein
MFDASGNGGVGITVREGAMGSPELEQAVWEFRRELPPGCRTAQAIDNHEPWEEIAGNAVVDGYVDVVENFKDLVEAVLGRKL